MSARSFRFLAVALLILSTGTADSLAGAPIPNTTVTATKVDVLADGDADNKVDPTEVIRYNIEITNTGSTDPASNVVFTDPTPANTTLIGASVNVSPLAFNDTYATIGNTLLRVGGSAGTGPERFIAGGTVLTNDVDFLNDAGLVNGHYRVDAIVNGASTNGGVVNLNTDGTFTYLPPVGSTTIDTFTYTIRDDGPNNTFGDADDLTNTGEVTITISSMVWYVDNSAGSGGDGRSSSPFDALADVTGATGPDAINQIIYIRTGSGDYTGGITLLNGQTLWGENEALVVDTFTLKTAGTDPVIANAGGAGVTLASNNTLKGFTVGNTSTVDITNTPTATAGTVTISNVILNGTGRLFNIDTASTLAVTLDTATTTSGAGTGINLIGCAGTFTANSASMAGVSGDDLLVNGGTVTVNYNGTINNTAGRSVNISNKTTSGNVTIPGKITDTGAGILLDNNDGATITLRQVSVSTGTNAGFRAINGGTVILTNAATDGIDNDGDLATDEADEFNSITTTTGVALEVNGTSIGGGGMIFRSISAGTAGSGPVNGILLDTTGSGGGLTVLGDGVDASLGGNGSGGTIQSTSGAGIRLNSTTGVSLNYVNITNPGTDLISVTNINGFTLNRCTITDSAGTGPYDAALDFNNYTNGDPSITATAVNGAINITNCILGPSSGNSPHNTLTAVVGSGTSTWNVTGSTFRRTGNSGINLELRNSAVFTAFMVDGCTFAGANVAGGSGSPSARGIFANNLDDSVITLLTIQNCTFTNNNIHIDLNQQNDTDPVGGHTFKILNNTTMTGSRSHAMNIFAAAGSFGGSFTGTIQGNVIGNAAVNGSGSEIGNGIRININGGTTATMLVHGNTIREAPNGRGLEVIGRNGLGTLDATITNNDIDHTNLTYTPGTSDFPLGAIFVSATKGGGAGITGFRVRTDVRNNLAPVQGVGGLPVASEVTGTYIALVEGTGSETGGILELLDSPAGPGGQTPTQQLQSVNTTDAGANAGVSLISGSINTPPPLLFAPAEIESFGMGMPDSVASAIALTEAVRVRSTAGVAEGVSGTPRAAVDSPAIGASAPSTAADLQQEELDSLAAAALARWQAAGISAGQLALLQNIRFEVADLPGWYLAEAGNGLIRIDRDAAGNGWFIDATPGDDGEFAKDGLLLKAAAPHRDSGVPPEGIAGVPPAIHSDKGGQDARHTFGQDARTTDGRDARTTMGRPALATFDQDAPGSRLMAAVAENGKRKTENASGQVDLLTTLMHELGHSLGLGDSYSALQRHRVMYGWLTLGERRLPIAGEASLAQPSAAGNAAGATCFLASPINIGILPPGKKVTVTYQTTANDPLPLGTFQISNQGTVTGDNFTTVMTDDPDVGGAADPTVTPVDRPDTSVVSINRDGASPTNTTGNLSWTVTFADDIIGLTSANFALVNTGLGGSPAITGVTAVGGTPATQWTVTASSGTGTGTLGLNFANDNGISHDITNTLPVVGQVYTIDRTPPDTTITLTPTNPSNSPNPSFSFTGSDTGGSGSFIFEARIDGGSYTSAASPHVFSGLTEGSHTFEVRAVDLAGNVEPTPASYTWTIDLTPPTVTVNQAAGQADPTSTSPILFTAQFSEDVSGFNSAADVTLSGTAGATTAVITPVDADTYTISVSGMTGFGTVIADIPANAATDLAGNTSAASTSTDNIVLYTDLISVSTAIAAGDNDAAETGGNTGLYTFTRGSTTGSVTVNFQLDASSTASATTDFTLSSAQTLVFNPGTGAGSIVIPNGSTTAAITLTALAETLQAAEAAETARLNVTSGTGYAPAAPPDDNATVTIAANGFLVTTTNDAGEGSLRQAVLNANAIAGTDTITFSDGTGGTVNFTDASMDTITLTTGQIDITAPLVIAGTGANKTTVSGNNSSRILSMTGVNPVRISGLTLANGNTVGNGGAAIYSDNSTLVVLNCAIKQNQTTAFGAGIFSRGIGGGTATLDVVGCTFHQNDASGASANGPAIWNHGGGGAGGGAGIARIVNSTFVGNAGRTATAVGSYNISGSSSTTVTNCTFSGNTFTTAGGGDLYAEGGSSTISVGNSILASSGNGWGSLNGGTLTSLGNNITLGGAGPNNGTTDVINTDPLLGPLQDNGGPTQTQALLTGSPALNTGSNALLPLDTFDLDGDADTAETLPVDQRGPGFIRAIGTVDKGAFELQKAVSILADSASKKEGTGAGTTPFTFTVSRTGDTSGAVMMNYAVTGSGGSPANAADFGGTLPSGTVTIPDTQASTTLTINVSQDAAEEFSEGFTVTISNPDNGYVVSGATATGTILNDDSTTTVLASPSPSVSGQTVTFTATVTGGSFTPTGTVTFSVDSVPLAPVSLNGSGQAAFSTSTLSVGLHNITATYNGDANLGGSTDDVNHTVNPAGTSTTLVSSLNPSILAESVTFTATVAAVPPGAGTPTGTVTFSVDSVPLAPVALDGSGQATFTTSSLAAGSHTIVAAYNGSVSFNTSTSNTVTQQVNAPTVSITATDNVADENTADTGTWRISRNTSAGTTVVQLVITASSTASAADWTQSGASFASLDPVSTGTATITPGNTFVDVVLTPTADIHAEAPENVRLFIDVGTDYMVGSPFEDIVTIAQNDFVVINTNDAGEGSLRQAVANANALAGTDTITFGGTVFTDATVPDTITLGGTPLGISSAMTIQGPGADVLIISGNDASRIIEHTSSGSAIRDVALTGGHAIGSGNSGAAGAIFNFIGSTLNLVKCQVSHNTSDTFGGGVYNSGTLTIVNSTISNNTANSNGSGGGGIASSGTLTIINSTISGNSAPSAAAGQGGGGGVLNIGGSQLTVINSTITNNRVSVAAGGGGIDALGAETLRNSIVAGNFEGAGATPSDIEGGTIDTATNNLIGDSGTAGGITHDADGNPAAGNNNIVGNAGSGTITIATVINTTLANNGGTMLTHALQPGGPAVDKGLNSSLPADAFDVDGDTNTAETLPIDQALQPRVFDNPTVATDIVDIGAFEVQNSPPTLAGATPGIPPQSAIEDGAPLVISLLPYFEDAEQATNTLVFTVEGNTNPTLVNAAITNSTDLTLTLQPDQFGMASITVRATDNGALFVDSTFTLTVTTQIDLVVTVVESVDPAVAGASLPGNLIHQVKVLNNGPSNATNLSLDIAQNLPSGVTVDSAVPDNGTYAGPIWTIPTLAENSQATLTITMSVAATAPGGTDLISTSAGVLVSTETRVNTGDDNDTEATSIVSPALMPLTLTTGLLGNFQNGFIEQRIRVTNNNPGAVPAFRVVISNLPGDVTVYNRHGTTPGGDPYILYNQALPGNGAFADLLVQYHRANGDNNFTPVYAIELLAQPVAQTLPGGVTQLAISRVEALPDGALLIEWVSTPGKTYYVRWSPDMTTFHVILPGITAIANKTQWVDRGPPQTPMHPTGAGSRFYEVYEAP